MSPDDDDRVAVLDHGYVSLVEAWGSDERVVEAARMSTAKGFLGWGPTCSECGFGGDMRDHEAGCGRSGETYDKPGDEKLLRYLWDHRHTSPFEAAGLAVEVAAPIFVLREWMRHRTWSYSERSARYTPLPDENYVPTVARVAANDATSNRQAQGAVRRDVSVADATRWLGALTDAYAAAQRAYALGLALGVPKELARLSVPVARYSVMRANANLLNVLKFLALRCDRAAQLEIRLYATAVAGLVAQRFPRTYEVARASAGLP